MSIVTFNSNSKGNISLNSISTKGKTWETDYKNAIPFPNIVLENFLPEDIIQEILSKFPTSNILDNFNDNKQNNKRTFNPTELESYFLKSIFNEFNSKRFLTFLEELTGIKGLIPDPDFLGGGFHETFNGGHLGIHADFNIHKRLNLYRRINVLIYLNNDWEDSFGGNLELWDKKMQSNIKSIAPIMNRCVIFNTDIDSYHGHPDPLSAPDNITRKSIALYYYTASEEIYKKVPLRSTVFKKRKGFNDPNNIKQVITNTLKDILPPIIARRLIYKKNHRR